MKREFLKGIEGLTEEAIDKIMAEHGKSIEAEKAKTNALKTENDTLKADKKSLEDKISEMTEKADSDADYKSQLEKLQKEIQDKEAAAQKEAEEQALTDAIVEVFGDAKFTSDYVRNGLIADMKAEIQKPENKGKGYAYIYKALTENKEKNYSLFHVLYYFP